MAIGMSTFTSDPNGGMHPIFPKLLVNPKLEPTDGLYYFCVITEPLFYVLVIAVIPHIILLRFLQINKFLERQLNRLCRWTHAPMMMLKNTLIETNRVKLTLMKLSSDKVIERIHVNILSLQLTVRLL